MTDIKDLVFANRSYRSFDSTCRVSVDELHYMIDSARMSPSAMNRQPLRYRVVTDDAERSEILAISSVGGLLKDRKLPPEGHEPAAYILICRDASVQPGDMFCAIDCGIAAEAITLSAVSLGLGCCMVAKFEKDKAKEILGIPPSAEPVLLIMIGKPDETSVVCRAADYGKTAYYRDKNNINYVPKLDLEKVLL